jgi:hypothetical protein
MTVDDLCHRLMSWHEQYPNPRASAADNAASRAAEDAWLSRFAGLDRLSHSEAADLVGWKFQSMPHRRAQAMKGISEERWTGQDGTAGAGELISSALAVEDDFQALALMAGPHGIYRFGPAMSSAVLAACRPARFTIADVRALASLRALDLVPAAGPPTFRIADWLPYLGACRELAARCGVSLRLVDRALWIAAADPGLGSLSPAGSRSA